MKKQGYIFLYIWALVVACQQKDTGTTTPEEVSVEKQAKNVAIPVIMPLQPDHEAFLEQWEAYKRLETEIRRFQKVAPEVSSGNIEELLRLEKEFSKSDFPEKLNIPAVKSRILVFKTYLLQAKSWGTDISTSAHTADQQRKIIIAFNALKKQFAEALTDDITEELLKNLKE